MPWRAISVKVLCEMCGSLWSHLGYFHWEFHTREGVWETWNLRVFPLTRPIDWEKTGGGGGWEIAALEPLSLLSVQSHFQNAIQQFTHVWQQVKYIFSSSVSHESQSVCRLAPSTLWGAAFIFVSPDHSPSALFTSRTHSRPHGPGIFLSSVFTNHLWGDKHNNSLRGVIFHRLSINSLKKISCWRNCKNHPSIVLLGCGKKVRCSRKMYTATALRIP